MAVLTKEELFSKLKEVVGDDTSDATISFLGDVNDTMDSLKDAEDWKRRYEDNDADWRKKYRDTFFNGKGDDSDDVEDEIEPKPPVLTFESLFS